MSTVNNDSNLDPLSSSPVSKGESKQAYSIDNPPTSLGEPATNEKMLENSEKLREGPKIKVQEDVAAAMNAFLRTVPMGGFAANAPNSNPTFQKL